MSINYLNELYMAAQAEKERAEKSYETVQDNDLEIDEYDYLEELTR